MKNKRVSKFLFLLAALVSLFGLIIDDDPRPSKYYTPIFEYFMMTIITFIFLMIFYFIFNYLYQKLKMFTIQLK